MQKSHTACYNVKIYLYHLVYHYWHWSISATPLPLWCLLQDLSWSSKNGVLAGTAGDPQDPTLVFRFGLASAYPILVEKCFNVTPSSEMVSLYHHYDSHGIALARYSITSEAVVSGFTSGNMLSKLVLLVLPQRTALESGMHKSSPEIYQQHEEELLLLLPTYPKNGFPMTTKMPPNLFGIYTSNNNSWPKNVPLCWKDNWIKSRDGFFYYYDENHSKIEIPLCSLLLWLVFGFPSEFSVSLNAKFEITEDGDILPNFHAGILFLNSANIIHKTFFTGFTNLAYKCSARALY